MNSLFRKQVVSPHQEAQGGPQYTSLSAHIPHLPYLAVQTNNLTQPTFSIGSCPTSSSTKVIKQFPKLEETYFVIAPTPIGGKVEVARAQLSPERIHASRSRNSAKGLSSEGQRTQMKTGFMFTNFLLKYNAFLNSEFCQEPLHSHDACGLAVTGIGYV